MHIVTAATAAEVIGDLDTVLIGGSGAGHAVPEALIAAIECRFLASGHPRQITSIHPVGIGNRAQLGVSRFAHTGMLKRIVCGTLVDAPAIAALAAQDLVEAYTLPQGALSQLIREIASGRPGLITHVGLGTFIDPRVAGGRQSTSAKEDLVELLEIKGKEWLFYKPFSIDVALLRGTTADENGNVTMEHEAVFGEMLSMAQATKRCGGIVAVQVKRLARNGTLPAKAVKIPGMLVDLVVVDPDQRQTYQTFHDAAYAGELRIPLHAFTRLPLDERKVVARRCSLELFEGAICNIGSGICTGIGLVAAEEDVLDDIVLTNEQGIIGGAPANGIDAGAGRNYSAMIDQPYQFDFYDGGGLDLAFLSAAEIDGEGNVNVSRFADKIVGVGGFVNISQNARTVVFGATFTAGGLQVDCSAGGLAIQHEGKHRKFVSKVEQISYNGRSGWENGQKVFYVTERAVFRLTQSGLELMEIAPGVSIERDILAHMSFKPQISSPVMRMESTIFSKDPIGLKSLIDRRPRPPHPRLTHLSDKSAP
jgi:propionate CoA-transferase